MKKFTLFLCFVIFSTVIAIGQNVGINSSGSNPDASAGLDVDFDNKGVLIPRVGLSSNTDVVTIPSPAVSLLVYNTNASMTNGNGLGFYYWDGTHWIVLGGAAPTGPVPGQMFYQSGRQVFAANTSASTPGSYDESTWNVPPGITMIRVQLAGGGGGSSGSNGNTASGACGGFVIGEIPVTPGETLIIRPGRGGANNTNTPRGGSGSSILRGSTVLAAAGGGGGGRGGTNQSTDGNGGGMAFGLSINGGNGSTSAGGSSGNNYVAYLYNSLSFIGKNATGGTINQAGVSARYFTELYGSSSNDNYGWGGRLGGNGTRGVIIIEW